MSGAHGTLDPHTCRHDLLEGELVVDRGEVADAPAGRPVLFSATLAVWCIQCGDRFRFLGVPGGVGACPHEPTVDQGATQLRAPVAPTSSIDLDEQLLCPVHGSRS